jgi:hypothetical protein
MPLFGGGWKFPSAIPNRSKSCKYICISIPVQGRCTRSMALGTLSKPERSRCVYMFMCEYMYECISSKLGPRRNGKGSCPCSVAGGNFLPPYRTAPRAVNTYVYLSLYKVDVQGRWRWVRALRDMTRAHRPKLWKSLGTTIYFPYITL